MNRIKTVDKGSIAEELDIEVGDILLSINEQPVVDIIDYMFLTNDETIEIEIQKPDGEIWAIEIDKDYDESLGIEFENPIIDQAKRCTNNCVFCFIDQLPKGMRESLYFKDDDSRLSFLQGNFVTLTNLKDADIDRIIRYRISPINVSVHTTDPALRIKMLGNRFAGNILERLKQLIDGGITVNVQIVLCPGYNDGDALKRTLDDLVAFHPTLNSVAIVPIGLTKHREGLIEMNGFDEITANATIEIVHDFQKEALINLKTRFAFLADEFYILAKQDFPKDEAYESYIQLEDGVGMIRKLVTEIDAFLVKPEKGDGVSRSVAMITGTAAAPHLEILVKRIISVYPNIELKIVPIVNHFFGEKITVSGLITGQDIMEQTKDLTLTGENSLILLPSAMFRADEEVLLDDMTRSDLEAHFGVAVKKVEIEGKQLMWHLLYGGTNV
jgi:putative radical SAM enzyme (TIGR03279 family)